MRMGLILGRKKAAPLLLGSTAGLPFMSEVYDILLGMSLKTPNARSISLHLEYV
ncbi:hypothetical protein HanPI659440_Chr09g0358021 [Helianthus annuus]|nr:hypothetical protein HanHA300_Chr09g0340981 [Helianthus annuus]KAJ0544491.1 hypothetical protein HanHA89_Chr09g0362261 [Helianthus annuus]KAJ0709493.1 hypothetical protein HanLR1_Chr09g0341001 [Helianthus annuus]KAJ0755441.1 hypothetical protein HanPI659440_Chr09g0358021 [Helianthus annuus]